MAQPDDDNDAEAAFGHAVRGARTTLGWTQDQLRRRLLDDHGIDLSKTAMARLELGQRPIRLNEVHALAVLLGMDLSGFGGAPKQTTGLDASVTRAMKLVEERGNALAREIEAVNQHLTMLDTARQEAHFRRDRLRAQLEEMTSLVKRLHAGKNEVEWAQAVLADLLNNNEGGPDGDR